MIRYFILILLIALGSKGIAQVDARTVFEKASNQVLVNNIEMSVHQTTTDKKGRIKEKGFDVIVAKIGEVEKTKMIMNAPERAAGITVVFSKSPNEDGIIEVFTPANGKTRKMLATPKNMAMVGSDFSISNYSQVDSDALSFKMLEELELNNQSCFKIEVSEDKEGNAGKAELIIEKDSYKIVQIDTYNEKGLKSSISKLSDYRPIDGIADKMQPMLIHTENLEKKESSEMKVLQITPKSNLKEEDFQIGSN